MKKTQIISMLLAIVIFTGGLANFSNAAVTAKDYTAEELDSSSYDLRKYTTPFWEGNIVYNEIVYPICSERGIVEHQTLMYDITEIVSVKNYNLDVTYENGKDYHLIDGKLYIPRESAIDAVGSKYIHADADTIPADYGEDEISPYYPHADGEGYEYWVGGTEICEKAISVTYIHNGKWNGPIPDSQADALPETMEKLMNKEDMTIVVAGDSVSTGAMGSGFLGIAPFTDAYPEMTAKALSAKFGYDGIKLVNSAIGGTMSYFDETKMNNTIINHSPDLVIINFGMNDSSCDRVGISGKEFHDNLALQIDYIKEKLPDCEILLLSSLYGNKYTFPAERYEEHAAVLHTLAEEYEGRGVGVCDPQRIEKYLMEERNKDFLCFMADNMVHPGDYGMRLMAQCILTALDVPDIESYKDYLIDDLTRLADTESHVADGKKAELEACLDELTSELKNLTEEWDINEVYNTVKDRIDAIIKRCDFEDHTFEHDIILPTCKDSGYSHATCTTCGFGYDYNTTSPIGGEHIMDTGVQTTSPTYRQEGVITYTCAKCGYEEFASVPMLQDPPTLETERLYYVVNSYNYMQGDGQPYKSGSGTVEFDICPLDIDVEGTPYVGVWFSGYTVTACYNFRKQQFEIISTNLPYSTSGELHAYKKYKWTPDSGEFKYNWKKFAVNVEGHTVRIYINGELILEDTNNLYRATTEVPLVYTIGEFYLDNFKVAEKGYDPATGTGDTTGFWDFNTTESEKSFNSMWGVAYSNPEIIYATSETYSTGSYKNHEHVLSYINTVERGCSHSGYKEYTCDICGVMMRIDEKPPLYEGGHKLTGRYLMEAPTDMYSGRYGYSCENCYMTFTETIPAGTEDFPVVKGDFNSDGVFDYIDVEYMNRYIKGLAYEYDIQAVDFNKDSLINNIDASRLYRYKRVKDAAS